MLRVVALALTTLTGFSGLVYEVAWQKYVATLLGSHSEATAAVLALFLGGLSGGYALFGRLTRRLGAQVQASRLLLFYGAVEGAIGVHALLFPLLFGAVRALSFAIPHAAGGIGFLFDVALTALLILPPTILMGGTIPVLTQALARSIRDATRIHAFVYAFNTLGAFCGALAAGLAILPWLGLEHAVIAMGAINLAAGAGFALLGCARREGPAPSRDPEEAAAPLGIYGAVAALAGFAAMALETVLIRIGGISIGSSEFTFSMVVAVFVLCIALGSFAVSALPRIPRWLLVAVQWGFAALLALLYPSLQDAPYWAHVVRSQFHDQDTAFYPYHLSIFVSSLAVLAVPVGLSGATLPLIFNHLRRQFGGLGSAAGRIYAWNTVGSLLGALLGGYLLLFWLDLDQVYLLALLAAVLAATLLTVDALSSPKLATAVLLLLPAVVAVALMPRWEGKRLASGLFRKRTPMEYTHSGPDVFFEHYQTGMPTVFYADDPTSSVAVKKSLRRDGRTDLAVITNGKADGAVINDYPTMALVALLPALFADRVERAFVIGFGTGVTVGEFAALDSIQRVAVAEISPGVIEAGALFEEHNGGALGSPKTEVIVSDAYRALLRSSQRWDIIASEPSNPWVAGVEMLFSREFLQAARGSLRPGGVYAQWFHRYENDVSVVELVLRTYTSVFDHVAVWYTLGPDLILLGFDDPSAALDLDRVQRRAGRQDIAAGLRRSGIASFPALLAHEVLPLGVVNAAKLRGDIHTILHPVLNHRAARAFFRGKQAHLPPTLRPDAAALGSENSLVARYRRQRGGRLSDREHEQLVGEACKARLPACVTLLADWKGQHPESRARDRMIAALRRDRGFATQLAPRTLHDLASLLGAERPGDAPISPTDARELTDTFVRYYHHGAPFRRDVLADVWRRCRDSTGGGDSCRAGQALAEERLGPLEEAAGDGAI